MKHLIILSLAVLSLTACGNRNNKKVADNAATETTVQAVNSSTVYVYYFHGKQRCKTCIAVEKITKETLDSLYSGNSSIVYTEVNTDDPAFSEITEKFQISWSSLIISKGEEKIDLTDFAFANALKSPELLKVELEKTLNNIL